jgi:hypothetical protein
MLKRLTLLAVAATALVAFVGSATAQADVLRVAEGSHNQLANGTKLTATSTNFRYKSSWFGQYECAKVVYRGELVKNSGRVEMVQNEATTGEKCNHTIVLAPGSLNLEALTGSWPSFSLTFDSICKYTGQLPFTYVYGSGNLQLTGTNQGSGGCGSVTYEGTFALRTAAGAPVEIAKS